MLYVGIAKRMSMKWSLATVAAAGSAACAPASVLEAFFL